MQSAWREVVRGLLRNPETREFVREIAREFVAVFREELAANADGAEWYDQKSSQCRESLGRNRWCKAVRARLQRDPHDPHAKHIGDRFLLDTQGLSEELDRASRVPMIAKAPAPRPPADPEMAGAARVKHLLGGHN